MPTKRFKSLVRKHVADDPAFAEALLREGIEAMLGGDVGTGKAILRDYIKATGGYEKLGRATEIQPKSLIRMLGNRGNPQAKNLFSIICHLRERSGLRLSVTLAARPGTKTPTQTRKAKSGPWRRRAA
jgi:DNA-binding phage protein